MGFLMRVITDLSEASQFVPRGRLIFESSERADRSVEVGLVGFSPEVGAESILLHRGATLYVGKGGTYSIDYDPLRDASGDSHSSSTVGQGGATVDG